MDAVEKRARELLAAEYMLSLSRAGPKQRHLHACAIRAIIAALTPPEGYVLVPVELTEDMLNVIYTAESDMSDDALQELWTDTLAARPEVP